jgi:nicotinamidase-related amidase
MTIPALLGRWLDTPTVNLGFSGSGRMETALADVLGEIDAAAYVLDCLPNMHYGMPPAEVERRTLAFVKRLREKRPTVPVVLVEDRTLGNAWLLPRLQREHKQTRAAYRAAFEKLVAGGVKNLRYIAGARLIGDDDEATIDASHLTDLGMWRQAKALVPVLKEATSNLQPSTLNERPAAAAGTDIYLRFREPTSPAVPVERLENWKFTETAIIICDMWDRHWCDHLNANLNELTPALAEVVKAARAKGVKIVHAPSDITEKFYKEHPARLAAKKFNTGGRNAWVHKFLDTEKGTPWPLDTRDQGCPDCWKKMRGRYLVWKQQDKRIDIAAGDIISERNDEVVGWLRANGVKNVILTGVATNMCVIGRPFGLRAMHLAGFNTVLMRDMTDVMYNQQYPSVLPAGKGTAPFVSHFAGLDLMVNYIEAHVCPTVVSTPFTGKPPFKFPSDKR